MTHRTSSLRLLAVLLPLLASPLVTFRAPAAVLPLEEIPVESPLYLSLEDLATRYGAPSGFLSTRPWTLADANALLDALARSASGCESDPAFVRVRREIARAAPDTPLRLSSGDSAAVEISPYVRLGYREDRTQAPAVVRDDRIGAAVAADLRGRALLFADYYAATWSPGPHGNPIAGSRFALVEGSEFTQWIDRAFVAVGAGALSVRAGHTWLRWGPGRSGTLGLSDAARALDLVEMRWRLLPAAQLTWFVAWLDPLKESHLAGHRLEIRASPSLSLGVAELARFDGSAHMPQYLVPVVGFNLREKQISRFSDTSADTQQAFSKNNVLWTTDITWRIRPGLAVSGELMIDDFSFSSAWRPTEIGWQLGGRASRRIGARDAAGARAEYTRIYNFTYSTWHRHDFEDAGLPLAYPFGPDVEMLLAEFEWNRGPDWTFVCSASRLQKGEGRIGVPWFPAQGKVEAIPLSGVVERTGRASLSASFRPGRRLAVTGEVGRVEVRNLDHTRGVSTGRWFGSCLLTVRW